MPLPEFDAGGGEAIRPFSRLDDAHRGKVGELGAEARLAEGGEPGEKESVIDGLYGGD